MAIKYERTLDQISRHSKTHVKLKHIATSSFRSFKYLIVFCLVSVVFMILFWHHDDLMFIKDYDESDKNVTYLLTGNHDVGRLGNKMFKYASLCGIASRERRQVFVTPYTQDFDMEKLFTLSYVDHDRMYNFNGWPTINEVYYARDDPVFRNLPQQNVYLNGYLQSFKYFQGIESVIRREYTLTDSMKAKASAVLRDIRSRFPQETNITFVGVHVRRKDERSVLNTTEAPRSFFVNAFHHMKALLPEQRLVFVVASNQLQWCHENLLDLNDTVVLPPESPDLHFAVLASCEHFVVSVGSYGWWAGWLTGGHVIYYKQFPWESSYEFNGFSKEDYYPPSWIPVYH